MVKAKLRQTNICMSFYLQTLIYSCVFCDCFFRPMVKAKLRQTSICMMFRMQTLMYIVACLLWLFFSANAKSKIETKAFVWFLFGVFMCLLWLLISADADSEIQTEKLLYDVWFAEIDVVVCFCDCIFRPMVKAKLRQTNICMSFYLQTLIYSCVFCDCFFSADGKNKLETGKYDVFLWTFAFFGSPEKTKSTHWAASQVPSGAWGP